MVFPRTVLPEDFVRTQLETTSVVSDIQSIYIVRKTMSKFPAAVAFVKELGKDTGKLGDLRRILKIEAHSKISKSALSKYKN